MIRVRSLTAALAVALALAPGLALARAGGGASMGSRGGFTYSAPPSTGVSPFSAAPMQRSFTPRQDPSFGAPSPGFGGGYNRYGGRSAFSSGLMGGLLGAGLGGMLFGRGLFGGIDGGGSIVGLLIQLALLFFIGRWVLRLVMARQPMLAGLGGRSGGAGGPGGARGAAGAGLFGGARAAPPTIAINPADYQAFEQLLKAMQAAWSTEDLNALRSISTPEMAGYFGEQLAALRNRGLRNTVTDVRLQKGDLAQAWAEGQREYATVAMCFAMIDVTRDGQNRVVDGSLTEEQVITEVWTFVRSRGGRWILSAIQQAR